MFLINLGYTLKMSVKSTSYFIFKLDEYPFWHTAELSKYFHVSIDKVEQYFAFTYHKKRIISFYVVSSTPCKLLSTIKLLIVIMTIFNDPT